MPSRRLTLRLRRLVINDSACTLPTCLVQLPSLLLSGFQTHTSLSVYSSVGIHLGKSPLVVRTRIFCRQLP